MRKNEFNIRKFWNRYAILSACMLAFCVSLGTATVSIAKALVLVGFLAHIVLYKKKILEFHLSQIPLVFFWIFIAIIWMLISMTWSQASEMTQWKYFYAHTRFLWVGVIYFQIRTKENGLKVLKWLIYGQVLVLCISWLMWLGIEVPLTRRPIEKGVAFTTSLEQPVMAVLVLIGLWNFRDYWAKQWGGWFVFLVIVANIVFVMSGRTGYLVFMLITAIEIYKILPKKWRIIAFTSPIILSAFFYTVSPTFHKRIVEIDTNIENYFKNNTLSSEGERLEMWKQTTLVILEKPILGYGIGGMPNAYKEQGGLIRGPVSQPHQQYLFWWVEFGFVGLMIMLGFFFTLIKDTRLLDSNAKSSLRSVIAVLFVMGLFNCPFFGAGMGEFFFLEIAALLAIKGSANNNSDLYRTKQ